MVQSWPTFIESNTISVLGVYMKWFSKMANLKSFPRFRFSPLGSYQISQNKFYSVYRWLWNCSVLLLKSRGSFSYFVTLISFRLFVRRAFFLITQTINVTKIGKSDGEKPVHKFIFFRSYWCYISNMELITKIEHEFHENDLKWNVMIN